MIAAPQEYRISGAGPGGLVRPGRINRPFKRPANVSASDVQSNRRCWRSWQSNGHKTRSVAGSITIARSMSTCRVRRSPGCFTSWSLELGHDLGAVQAEGRVGARAGRLDQVDRVNWLEAASQPRPRLPGAGARAGCRRSPACRGGGRDAGRGRRARQARRRARSRPRPGTAAAREHGRHEVHRGRAEEARDEPRSEAARTGRGARPAARSGRP